MAVKPYMTGTVQNPTIGSARLADVPANIEISPVELIAEDAAVSRGLFYRPRGRRPKAGIHLMHPRTDQSTNYNIMPLVKAGYAVLGRAGRWPNNDSATTHEHLLLDVAAGIRMLREEGCEQVLLLGNSGGSSLAAFYQAQASQPSGRRLTHTAAGDPFNLNQCDLPGADGIIIIGGHIGQGGIMRKLIDPSVVDEADQLATDPALDMYDLANGFVPPPASSHYSKEFLQCYEAAQHARVRRLDAIAMAHVERQRDAQAVLDKLGSAASLAQVRAAKLERFMIIYRTAAYPAFTDTSIEPDGRNVRSYFSTIPQYENFAGNGLARYITPRAWLSTWSENYSRASTILNLALQAKPLLVLHYSGDCGTRLSEVQAMLDASPSPDKRIHFVHGTDHYGLKIMPDGSNGPRMWEGPEIAIGWLKERFPV